MTVFRTLLTILPAFALFATLATSAHADQHCPPFKKVVWWQTSHEEVAKYVTEKHYGKWSGYVRKWDFQLRKMKDIQERGGAALFKSKGLRLEGKALDDYVQAVEDRLAVTVCLAKREIATARAKKTASDNDG